MTHRLFVATFVAFALATTALAQGGTFLYQNAKHGFRLRVPRMLKEAPLDPQEEQILAKFTANVESPDPFLKGEILELNLLVFRIGKAKGPATGDDAAKKAEEERARSMGEQSKEFLNGATDFPTFLKRREIRSDFVSKNAWTKPVKSKDGGEYKLVELHGDYHNHRRGQSRNYVLLRGFLLENATEIYGLYAYGWGLQAFETRIDEAVRSFERVTIDPNAKPVDEDDPYADSTLRDLERRRMVRSQLVKGWSAHDSENFILVTNITSKKTIEEMLADLEIMRVEYTKHFPPLGPMEAVSTVRVCASYDDYLGYGAPDGTGGYWAPLKEELVLFEPGKRIPKQREWVKEVDTNMVLYHEAMHQYLHYANGMVPPASWFNEGYGEYFGGAKVDRVKGEIRRIEKNAFRMKWVKLMQKQKAWPDLRMIFLMPQHEFYGVSVMNNYAMGWSICWFLEQEREKKTGRNEDWAAIPENYLRHLRAAADKYRERMPDNAPKDWMLGFADEIQKEAFEKTFAKIDILQLEKAWIAAMAKY